MTSYTKPMFFSRPTASYPYPLTMDKPEHQGRIPQAPRPDQRINPSDLFPAPSTDVPPTTMPIYTIGCGGPLLLNIYRPVYAFHIVIKSAGASFAKLRMVSSLSFSHGLCVKALELFAYSLQATVYSGKHTAQDVPIRVISGTTQASLEIGVGPAGMDHNDLFLRTVTGETFVELIHRLLIVRGNPDLPLVALMPVESSKWDAIARAPRHTMPQPFPRFATHNVMEMN